MKTAIHTCIHFFKKETVLCTAGLPALLSAFFVPPSFAYLEYLDLRVLSLLFCLMLVVAGLQNISGYFGIFTVYNLVFLILIETAGSLILK